MASHFYLINPISKRQWRVQRTNWRNNIANSHSSLHGKWHWSKVTAVERAWTYDILHDTGPKPTLYPTELAHFQAVYNKVTPTHCLLVKLLLQEILFHFLLIIFVSSISVKRYTISLTINLFYYIFTVSYVFHSTSFTVPSVEISLIKVNINTTMKSWLEKCLSKAMPFKTWFSFVTSKAGFNIAIDHQGYKLMIDSKQ